jgi:hypothetical protein
VDKIYDVAGHLFRVAVELDSSALNAESALDFVSGGGRTNATLLAAGSAVNVCCCAQQRGSKDNQTMRRDVPAKVFLQLSHGRRGEGRRRQKIALAPRDEKQFVSRLTSNMTICSLSGLGGYLSAPNARVSSPMN